MFDNNQVSNELESYLLGFFYADGCISKYECNSYRMFFVALSEKDKQYLQWMTDIINKSLGTSYELKYVKQNKSYKLSVYRKDFINNLVRLGISNNKTYEDNSFVFDNVPDDLKRHFIRGYFDGDGSISFYKKKDRCQINLISLNNKLICSISKYVYDIFHFGSIRMDQKYTRYQLCGNVSTKKFLSWIYNNANYYMKRKHDRYLKIPPKKSKNIYKGIYKENRYKNIEYYATIYYDKKRHYIGTYKTVKEAVDAYNIEAKKHGLELQEYKGENLYEN